MPTKSEKDALTGRETTGHEWDGIRELNTPLPRWWLYIFAATIVFAIGYMILFPSVPWINGYYHGLLGFSQRVTLAENMKTANQREREMRQRIAAAALAQIRQDPEL